MDKKNTTEDQILKAAREVFIEKGMDGARMQEIADRAGINKALLHYYFRSKEKLFRTIFKNLIHTLFKNINQALQNEENIFNFIQKFVRTYLALLDQNPYLPNFIVNEINRNHENIVQIIESSEINRPKLEQLIKKEMDTGNIRPITLNVLIIDVLSLCIFPVAAKPLILNFLYKGDVQQHEEFTQQRADHIIELITQYLTPAK